MTWAIFTSETTCINLFRFSTGYVKSVTEIDINKYRCIQVKNILIFKCKNLESSPCSPSSPLFQKSIPFSQKIIFQMSKQGFCHQGHKVKDELRERNLENTQKGVPRAVAIWNYFKARTSQYYTISRKAVISTSQATLNSTKTVVVLYIQTLVTQKISYPQLFHCYWAIPNQRAMP